LLKIPNLIFLIPHIKPEVLHSTNSIDSPHAVGVHLIVGLLTDLHDRASSHAFLEFSKEQSCSQGKNGGKNNIKKNQKITSRVEKIYVIIFHFLTQLDSLLIIVSMKN
jgi:hypothetical protein